MRRAVLIAVGVGTIAVVFGFTAFNPSTHRKPSLRVSRATPLTVQGRHFRASEVVRLTTGSRTIRTKATGSGFFVISIPGADRCNTTRVVARGSAGSYAIVKLLPAPMCLPARSSG
jgi:hypothetical protein